MTDSSRPYASEWQRRSTRTCRILWRNSQKESDENEMKLRKEEAERAKLEEERAALGLDAPEDPEPESNSA